MPTIRYFINMAKNGTPKRSVVWDTNGATVYVVVVNELIGYFQFVDIKRPDAL